MGKAYVHTVFNDHSRVAYPEIHDDETAITATAVRVRVVEWLNACGELEGWLHCYNHHRPHTSCGNQPPFSRLTNVPGQHI